VAGGERCPLLLLLLLLIFFCLFAAKAAAAAAVANFLGPVAAAVAVTSIRLEVLARHWESSLPDLLVTPQTDSQLLSKTTEILVFREYYYLRLGYLLDLLKESASKKFYISLGGLFIFVYHTSVDRSTDREH
jgi:hypothetical protein